MTTRKQRDWTPIRRDGAYCSPACGGGCSIERYTRAKASAEAAAKDLGAGWSPQLNENLGWYARVGSPCRRIWISLDGAQDGKVRFYTAFLGPPREAVGGGKWAETAKTARGAIERVLRRALADIGLATSITEGLAVPPRRRMEKKHTPRRKPVGSSHCYSRSCLRGSAAGDRTTALLDPTTFTAAGCECACAGCAGGR